MIFAILTLLTALALASVAGWFSIIGVMSIFAAFPLHALVMGIVLECGKLMTASWLYRNWKTSRTILKAPLIIFTLTLTLATSMGVFGFLSKAHLEQGSATVDNSGKVERLDQQIAREKAVIDGNNRVIGQLDATLESYIGKDRADRSVFIRRSQEPQRKQLRDETSEAQKRVDQYSDEKLKLQSEVRKLQLEVGPIRYISELIYGSENSEKNIESAVRIFILLIVSTFDPLAITLLIAANQSLMNLRKRDEKEEIARVQESSTTVRSDIEGTEEIRSAIRPVYERSNEPPIHAGEIQTPLFKEPKINEKDNMLAEFTAQKPDDVPIVEETRNDATTQSTTNSEELPLASIDTSGHIGIEEAKAVRASLEELSKYLHEEKETILERPEVLGSTETTESPREVIASILQPSIEGIQTEIPEEEITWEEHELSELHPHFVPIKVNEKEKPTEMEKRMPAIEWNTGYRFAKPAPKTVHTGSPEVNQQEEAFEKPPHPTYPPKVRSWIKEFKRS